MSEWEVIVGNVGIVYRGDDARLAALRYIEYRDMSRDGYGRASGESVALIRDDRIVEEYIGSGDLES